ncbi:hypothetical protein VTO42DRAFT_3888 [Malbranchea cinnamomea]
MSAAVIGRRNKQIQDAIDGQNLKQALQLCEKRIKKGEDTPFLRAWKANILFNHADEAHHQRGIAEALELCRTKPPITDINALELLQNTLGEVEEHTATARAIWENAAKAKPQDWDLQLRWFDLATEAGDWKTAQKAAMSLQNNFPKTRKCYFWAIFMSYLVSLDPKSSDAERNLFGTLAYRMISKAADSVPSDPKELLSPARAIQTSEELLLLTRIFDTQRRYDEVVKILNSENLGVSSRIVQGDWSFVTTKLDALEKAGYWEEALAYTRELLKLPDDVANAKDMSYREKDDWKVWNLLLTATRKLEKEETVKQTDDFISEYIDKCPMSRNAQLARLDLVQSQVSAGSLDSDSLLSACKDYFDRNGSKVYCFHDLRKYISTLDPSLQEAFQQHLSQCETLKYGESKVDDPSALITIINVLKFEYCFQLSGNGSKESKSKTEDFARRCLKLFHATARPTVSSDAPLTIETHPADDLCLLAAMSLIRFYVTDDKSNASHAPHHVLIQAAAILEHLILKSPHNYEALLLLVRIHLLIGAGSQALKSFSKLNVKQMQYETVAHNLFTRLATIHPHSAPPFEGMDFKDIDPQMAMRQALQFYRGSEISIPYACRSGLNHGSYVNVQKTIDFQKSLQNSICRRMWALETRRMQRIVGGPGTAQYHDIVSQTTPVVDNRNFDGFMDCERPGQTTIEERVRLGPLPGAQFVKVLTTTDILFNFLNQIAPQKKIPADATLPTVDLDLQLPQSELTTIEVENTRIHVVLLRLISILTQNKKEKSDSTDSAANADDLAAQLESWLTETHSALSSSSNLPKTLVNISPSSSPSSSVPSWVYFHYAYSTLETLKAMILFTGFASKLKPPQASTRLSKENLNALNKLALTVVEDIKAQTQALKSRLAGSGLLGQLVDLVLKGPDFQDQQSEESTLAGQIEELVGTTSLELFCGSLMESWDEALDGILTVCGTLAV